MASPSEKSITETTSDCKSAFAGSRKETEGGPVTAVSIKKIEKLRAPHKTNLQLKFNEN